MTEKDDESLELRFEDLKKSNELIRSVISKLSDDITTVEKSKKELMNRIEVLEKKVRYLELIR